MSVAIRRVLSPSYLNSTASASRHQLRTLRVRTPFSSPAPRICHHSRPFTQAIRLRTDGDDTKPAEADVSLLAKKETIDAPAKDKQTLPTARDSRRPPVEVARGTRGTRIKNGSTMDKDTQVLTEIQEMLKDYSRPGFAMRGADDIKAEFAKLSPVDQRTAAAEWKVLKKKLEAMNPEQIQRYVNSMTEKQTETTQAPQGSDLESTEPGWTDAELQEMGLERRDIDAMRGIGGVDAAGAERIHKCMVRMEYPQPEINEMLEGLRSRGPDGISDPRSAQDLEAIGEEDKDAGLVAWQRKTGITDAKLTHYLDVFGDFKRLENGQEMILNDTVMEAMHAGRISESRVAELLDEFGAALNAEIALAVDNGEISLETMQPLMEHYHPDIALAIARGQLSEGQVDAMLEKYPDTEHDFVLAYFNNEIPREQADALMDRLGPFAPHLELMRGLISGKYSESSVLEMRDKYTGISPDTVAGLIIGEIDAAKTIPLLEKFGGKVITSVMMQAIEEDLVDEAKIEELVAKYPGIWDMLIINRVQKTITAREIRRIISAKSEEPADARELPSGPPAIQLPAPKLPKKSPQAILGEEVSKLASKQAEIQATKEAEARAKEPITPISTDPAKQVAAAIPGKDIDASEMELVKKALAGDAKSIDDLLVVMKSRQQSASGGDVSDAPQAQTSKSRRARSSDQEQVEEDTSDKPWEVVKEYEPGEGLEAITNVGERGVQAGLQQSQAQEARIKKMIDDLERSLENDDGEDEKLAKMSPEERAAAEKEQDALISDLNREIDEDMMPKLQTAKREMEQLRKELEAADIPEAENDGDSTPASLENFMEGNKEFIDELLAGKYSEDSLLETAENFQEKYEEFIATDKGSHMDPTADMEHVKKVMARLKSEDGKDGFTLKDTMDLMTNPATLRIYKEMQDMGLSLESTQAEILEKIHDKFAKDEGKNTHFQDKDGNEVNVFYPRNVDELRKIKGEIAAGRGGQFARETGVTHPDMSRSTMTAPGNATIESELDEPGEGEFFADFIGRQTPNHSFLDMIETQKAAERPAPDLFNYTESIDDPDRDAGGGDEPFEGDDLTSMGHGELEQHRELREYARLAAWELPLLHKLKKPFEHPTQKQPLRFRYTTYMGDNHPASKKVVLEFDPADLPGLTEPQRNKLIKLVGPRFNPSTSIIKMSCESFETQAQNKRYLGDLVSKLVFESRTGADTFADVPIDLRHHKRKKEYIFPEEWKVDGGKKKDLNRGMDREQQAAKEGDLVDGLKVIDGAMKRLGIGMQDTQREKVVLGTRTGTGAVKGKRKGPIKKW